MKENSISNLTKTQCYGCSACQHICPVQAIEMKADQEGFYYPVVDESKCINCGKCRKSCPGINDKDMSGADSPDCFALWAEDRVRMGSSSGGAFTLLAKEILGEGGIVCGVAMDEKFYVHHVFVDSVNDLEPLRGSKYVQSDLQDTFPKIKEYLGQGRKVLFVGTPCQVAGLKSYLNGNAENLLAVDLVCHGPTSQMVLDRYLEESFGKENIKRIKFRPKNYGYNGTTLEVLLNDGQRYMGTGNLDPFERGCYRSLMLRRTCQDCKFAEIPRQGDITIGDFWGIGLYKAELNDGRGTSVVLVNNDKGKEYLEKIKEKTKLLEKVPLEVSQRKNRFKQHMEFHSQRDRFFEMLSYTSMHKAVTYCMENRYDVGLLGVWFGCNYGSIATYYGLMKQLQDLGLSVLMIDKPGFAGGDRELSENNHNRIFSKNHFHVSRSYKLHEMHMLNHICDSFVIGSDQVWNYGIAKGFGYSFLMDFVRDEKKKVAVAASFGHDRDFRSDRERIIAGQYFKRFDAISVREKSAVDILDKIYGIPATQVLDPVFSTDRSVYDEIADESERCEKEPYILTYILDPTPEKKEAIRYLSEKMGMRTLHILDGVPWKFEENKQKMDMDTILEDVQFQDWVYYFKNSSYVITDSCHGMSFAIIYRKPFAGIGNVRRGMTRFNSLTGLFHLEHRLVKNAEDIIKNEEFLKPIDYTEVDEIMDREVARSREWLKNAMFSPKKVKTYQSYSTEIEPLEERDFKHELRERPQVKQTFPRRVYAHLPIPMQNKIKKVVKKYIMNNQ